MYSIVYVVYVPSLSDVDGADDDADDDAAEFLVR